MKRELYFIFESKTDADIFSANPIQNVSFSRVNNNSERCSVLKVNDNLNFDVQVILVAIFTGGTVAAIIKLLRDVIIANKSSMKKTVIIESKDRKVHMEFSDNRKIEEIFDNELLRELLPKSDKEPKR